MYLGSWKVDDLLTFAVNTHTTAGAASDADSAPTYRVYEDETGTAILTGTMALLDDANTLGQYSEQITLSAANGFEKGRCYNIRITATVGGTAGATIRSFQMEAEVDANVVSATVNANITQISGDSTAADNAESFFDGTGYAGTNNVIPTVTAVGSVSGAVGSVTGAVGSVTGNVGGNVVGSVGSLATQAKADVNTEVDTALTDYDPPTRTEATSDKAEILAAIPTPPTASAIADQVWDEALSGHLTAGSTGAALNAANAPTAAAVADAVWDEALSGHTTAGTAGKALSDAATGGTVTISYSQVALALAAAVSAGTITLRRGDRISLQITGLGVLPAGRDKLWFTVKSAPVSQADSASIIQVTETGGLLYLNGLVPGTASTEVSALTSADGSLTVDDATDGDVTLVLSAAASALLAQRQSLAYDLQYQDGSTVTTLAQGIANVVADVTRAVS